MSPIQQVPAVNDTRKALSKIVESVARQHVDIRETKKFKHVPTDGLYTIRLKKAHTDSLSPEIPAMSTVLARREIGQFSKQDDLKQLKKAVYAVLGLLKSVSRRMTVNQGKQLYRALGADLIAVVKEPHPQWVTQFISDNSQSVPSSKFQQLLGMSKEDWQHELAVIRSAQVGAGSRFIDRLETDEDQAPLSAADRLTRVALSINQTSSVDSHYDGSDAKVKILSVRVRGFRGSPNLVEVQFAQAGKPVSTLLWGDNGTGKSSVIDGIEFALQGRVDRSADFNSSLRSAVQNVASDLSSSTVALSDGSTVTRSLKTDRNGRFKATWEPVRPGFCIAPIVIRRADILRFLDTETLARGTVFFDYFPEPGGSIGQRPTEELSAREEEQFALRVARGDLAAQLAKRVPGTQADLTTSDGLERFVRTELFAAGQSGGLTEEECWESLDTDTRDLVKQLRSTQSRLRALKKKLEQGVNTLNPIAYQRQLERVRPVLESIAPELTASFERVANVPHVKALHTLVAHSGPVSLDIVVEFTSGASAFPQQVFSEGYKDLIALLFFLAVTKRAADMGQARVLILDDALQSVDSSVRVGLMSYVLDEFKDWQLIVTGHDKAWHAQLRALFNSRGIPIVDREIIRWDFDTGPLIREGAWTTLSSLQNALARADMQATASSSGVLLEQIAHELSWRLGSSVKRKQEDRYTLSDLWGGIYSILRKREQAKSVCEKINSLISIRNLLGAHYNEWAASIPSSDIVVLAEEIMELYRLAYCQDCHSWIQQTGSVIACKKGHQSI
jgi:recombinational DNA repair ATPase RecF